MLKTIEYSTFLAFLYTDTQYTLYQYVDIYLISTLLCLMSEFAG